MKQHWNKPFVIIAFILLQKNGSINLCTIVDVNYKILYSTILKHLFQK